MILTDINIAAGYLKQNLVVAIPTETVYGLAGNAFNEESVEKIFEIKQRPHFNPLIVHIRAVEYLQQVAVDIPPMAMLLAEKFWPGPLTMVLKKASHISNIVTGGLDTVGVRMPAHPVALALLNALDFPLAAPSANPFKSISPTTAQHVYHYFGDSVPVLDGGECEKGVESTIIGFQNDQPVLYRHGSISLEEIEQVVGEVTIRTHNESAPQAPGMLLRHYAPDTETFLTNDVENLIRIFEGEKIAVLLFRDSIDRKDIVSKEILSPSGDMVEAAKNLYAALHRLDKCGADVIIAERLPDEGLGKTVNDRLQRAVRK